MDYTPSLQAWEFHRSRARFRHLVWGSRSGKTVAGAVEFLRWAGGLPGSTSWAVAPTLLNLEQAEHEVFRILDECHIRYRSRRSRGEYRLPNTSILRFKSAHEPKHLKGGTVTGILWCDEFATLVEIAWTYLRPRIASSRAPMCTTSTPEGRNWTWPKYLQAGLPSHAPYGMFESEDGSKWISHYPTWELPWVTAEEIQDQKDDMTAQDFEQEVGAMFITTESKVFPYVHEALSREKIPMDLVGSTVMGLDLAKQQDFTAVLVMDPARRVLHVNRWTKVNWRVQKPRIIELAKRWNAVVMIDTANVGSVIAEDLRAEGVTLIEINMNSPDVKNQVIEGLQISFEKGMIRIPDPDAPWVPSSFKILVHELDIYEARLTRGKRVSYNAPKNLHDDTVIALALANVGVGRGAAGAANPEDVMISRSEFGLIGDTDEEDDEEPARAIRGPRAPRAPRPRTFRRIFGRTSKLGIGGGNGRLWED